MKNSAKTAEIRQILSAQREFFASGATLPVDFRLDALKKLKTIIKSREQQIAAALFEDLGKSPAESYMCEIGLTLSELSYILRHARRFARNRRVHTPLAQFASKSFVRQAPYGNVLIMSPWNYPFLLTLDPLIDALAAGNTAIVKPSAYSPATSAVIADLIRDLFPPEYVACVTGGRAENSALLDQKFDLIFFTGSQTVGREVIRASAEHLTPVILELGGKSPCIVDSSAKIPLAARRIVWGKFLNCGQTCVAPDFVYVQNSVHDQLISALRSEIARQFGTHPLKNPSYGKIISPSHFTRLSKLIKKGVVIGGKTNPKTRQIEPTLIDRATPDHPAMQEEIFGPILPILPYDRPAEILDFLKDRPKPLALYVFSERKTFAREIISHARFGGGCINDVVIHLATSNMGFGGVGESGLGAYHGRTGFEAFSHAQSIVDKKTWLDLPLRYQPISDISAKLIRLFMR